MVIMSRIQDDQKHGLYKKTILGWKGQAKSLNNSSSKKPKDFECAKQQAEEMFGCMIGGIVEEVVNYDD